MLKKKKQSRSQSSIKKNLEPSSDSSPSPRLLSIFRSKLASGKDLKHMLRGMRSKTVPGLSSQSRIVRCPKCHKLLQEPIDATSYKCSGCDSILQAKRWELEGNDNSIPEALLSSQNRSLSTEVESAEVGSKTPMRSTHREYNSRASPSVERGYHSETVYKHETSDIRREWMRRADEFSVTGDSDVFASARSSPYNSRTNASEWTQHEGRYEELPRPPFYPASPSPSSAYEYGYSSPFHGSHVSASEQSYYQNQPNQFKQYGREGWFQESSVSSPVRFPGETSVGKYYQWPSQSQYQNLQYRNLYESSSSANQHHSLYSEVSYQAAAVPHRSTYSERAVGIYKSETSSEKSSHRDKKRNVRERKPVVKRHVLPSAGGAPFATCSYCLELLQLPQVSLRGKHKRYQVRCGSCSGVLQFSIPDKADTVLDSPSFVDSGTGFVDETVTNHQDSTSQGHEEAYPDDSHLLSSENGSGDRIYKSTDDIILSRSLKTFEDKGIIEDIRSISSKFLDSKLEALQPQLKPSVNHWLREQEPASSESDGETSRFHLEQSEKCHPEKSIEKDNNIFERAGCDLEECRYKENEILKPEEMVGKGSGESLEVPVNKNERMSESTEEAEIVAEKLVSQSVEPLYKNEYIYEARLLSENTRDTHEFDQEETQENEESGAAVSTWEAIMGDKQGQHWEKSRYIGDSICNNSSSYGETFEDTTVKEDTEHKSNTISDVMSAAPESPLKSLVDENQSFIGQHDQSGETTVTISRIHEEQSEYDYENLSERQELDETNEILEPGKVSKDESSVSLEKASEIFKTIIEGQTGEEQSVSHQMDPQNETVAKSFETLEPVYLEGCGYAGERSWAETMEDRVGLHLEEFESNYGNYNNPFEWTSKRAPTFSLHEYELGTMLEPDKDADGFSESSSRGSFNGHESSEESDVFHESQDTKPDNSPYEYENSSKIHIVRSELHECGYETNETLEPSKMVGVGSVVSLEKSSEKIMGVTGEERSVSHQISPQNESVDNSYRTVEPNFLERSGHASETTWAETMGDGAGLQLEEYESNPFEWSSERAPTFRLHEKEPGTIPEPEEEANGRSISNKTDIFSDHESSNDRDVSNEEEPWLVDENKTVGLNVRVMGEDGPSSHLENCRNDSMELEETFEWTSAPTFRLDDYELRTMLEPDEDVGRRSESSSRGSFDKHESSKITAVFHEEEPQLGNDSKTDVLQIGQKVEDGPSQQIEKMKLDETFEWTSGRALTFRVHEYEPGTIPERDEEGDGRSESSSRGSFNDHESSKERAMNHEDELILVEDHETEALKVSLIAEDGLHLENAENKTRELDNAFEPRNDIFMLSPDHTLEQERMMFHLELSQDKQENLRQTFKQSEAEEDIPEFGSRVSSESHESPSKMAEVDSEAEEERLGDDLVQLKEETEKKSGLTSEPNSHIHSTTEPSEIVGLRHALYQTQSSPLRPPLTSPIHTPIGSPLHYLMGSQIRSPIASPMHSHIVSPLRSPINTSGSLTDVLFFRKKG